MRTWTISTPTHSKTLDDHEKQTAEPVSEARMDTTLARRKVGSGSLTHPPACNRNKCPAVNFEALTEDAFDEHNRERREWHANLGRSKPRNLRISTRTSGTSSTATPRTATKPGRRRDRRLPRTQGRQPHLDFARNIQRREVKEQGTTTSHGHERWPVCRVGLTGNTGMVEFNRAMLAFFAHPAGNTWEYWGA